MEGKPEEVILGTYKNKVYCCHHNRWDVGWFADGYLHHSGIWQKGATPTPSDPTDGYFETYGQVYDKLAELYGEQHGIKISFRDRVSPYLLMDEWSDTD